MKSYLPAAAMGIALTAAAFGFGAATAHASDYTNGSTTLALSQCSVTGGVTCPSSND